MMAPVGGAVGPVLMGLVGDYADMHWAFVVPFVGYVVVWFYARHMMQQKN